MSTFINGAYIPDSTFEKQEYQREKLEKDYKNKNVLALKNKKNIEKKSNHNKKIVKSKKQEVEKKEMIYNLDGYLPILVIERQESEITKNEFNLKEIKKSLLKPKVEEVPVQKELELKPKLGIIKSKSLNNNKLIDSNIISRNNSNKMFGEEYLLDCGIVTSWLFECSPWRNEEVCVDGEVNGAWVPFIVKYRTDYEECKFVKEDTGREFSQDHGTAYK